MKRTLLSHKDRISATRHGIFCLLIAFIVSSDLRAQTPDEHASHHPGGAAPAAGVMLAAPGAAPAMSGTPAAGGGMMEQMGEMMKGMGQPPPKELYPTLMALPELTPEQRKEVEDQANGRMLAGSNLIGQALDALNAGTVSGDYAAMHKATSLLREGTAQLESGIAARQALAEGRAPRDVALAWFKREMRIQPGTALAGPQKSGTSVFHLFTMVLLIGFALAMVAMYFFKMRRAAALFGRIEADKKSPPPGSAPELAGGKPASAP